MNMVWLLYRIQNSADHWPYSIQTSRIATQNWACEFESYFCTLLHMYILVPTLRKATLLCNDCHLVIKAVTALGLFGSFCIWNNVPCLCFPHSCNSCLNCPLDSTSVLTWVSTHRQSGEWIKVAAEHDSLICCVVQGPPDL